MPGEFNNSFMLTLKTLIALYEILITKASVRLDEHYLKNTSKKIEWISYLEKNLIPEYDHSV